jgi:hypothetical protein
VIKLHAGCGVERRKKYTVNFNPTCVLFLFLSVRRGIIEDTCRDPETSRILLCG